MYGACGGLRAAHLEKAIDPALPHVALPVPIAAHRMHLGVGPHVPHPLFPHPDVSGCTAESTAFPVSEMGLRGLDFGVGWG
eukprot:1289887-Rhodomonas_salina.1